MANEFKYNINDVIKCENCGADMVFDPNIQALHCGFCDSTKDINKRVPMMRDYLGESDNGEVQYDGDSYKCPNCGGTIEYAVFSTSAKCPYCGSTNIVDAENQKGLKPDSILPFLISKEDATLLGNKWIKKKPFAPSKLKKEFKVENFHGVYIPSFLFSTSAYSNYSGRLGQYRTRTVGVGKNSHTETYIYWFNVCGGWQKSFSDLSVEASIQLRQQEFHKLLPFDTQNAEAYQKEYISGFVSESYDTSLKDCFEIARVQMENVMRDEIVKYYKADVIGRLDMDNTYSNTKFRYLLLPLWVCAYKYKQKGYRFLINGRNGKSTGKYPKSAPKILGVIFSILSIVAAVIIALFATGQLVV